MKSFALRFLVTLCLVAVAATVAWQLWVYYMDAPWTRDGRVRADIVEKLARRPQIGYLGVEFGILGSLQRATHRPHMSTVFDTAQEDRIVWRLVGQRFGLAEQHPAVGDHHLVARIQPQECRVGPAGDRGISVSAHLIGPVGADPRQQRHGM